MWCPIKRHLQIHANLYTVPLLYMHVSKWKRKIYKRIKKMMVRSYRWFCGIVYVCTVTDYDDDYKYDDYYERYTKGYKNDGEIIQMILRHSLCTVTDYDDDYKYDDYYDTVLVTWAVQWLAQLWHKVWSCKVSSEHYLRMRENRCICIQPYDNYVQ